MHFPRIPTNIIEPISEHPAKEYLISICLIIDGIKIDHLDDSLFSPDCCCKAINFLFEALMFKG